MVIYMNIYIYPTLEFCKSENWQVEPNDVRGADCIWKKYPNS